MLLFVLLNHVGKCHLHKPFGGGRQLRFHMSLPIPHVPGHCPFIARGIECACLTYLKHIRVVDTQLGKGMSHIRHFLSFEIFQPRMLCPALTSWHSACTLCEDS